MRVTIESSIVGHSDELYHYGVKGMKWGKHKAAKKALKDARYDDAMAELELARAKKASETAQSKANNPWYGLPLNDSSPLIQKITAIDKSQQKRNEEFVTAKSAQHQYNLAQAKKAKTSEALKKAEQEEYHVRLGVRVVDKLSTAYNNGKSAVEKLFKKK